MNRKIKHKKSHALRDAHPVRPKQSKKQGYF